MLNAALSRRQHLLVAAPVPDKGPVREARRRGLALFLVSLAQRVVGARMRGIAPHDLLKLGNGLRQGLAPGQAMPNP